MNQICSVFVSMLVSNSVDREFKPQSGQIKDYTIGIWCFSAKLSALNDNSKDGFAWIHDNVSEWRNMSTRVLGFFSELTL